MRRFDQWIDKEWLLTNGLGSYAATTPIGVNTRKYHGWFVVALDPPVNRHVLLSKCEERLLDGTQSWLLDCNEYPGAVHPDGYQWLEDFTIDPLPQATYQIGEIRLTKRWVMPHGQQIVQIQYCLESSPRPITLEIRPLVAGRDYHSLLRESPYHVKWVESREQCVAMMLGESGPLYLDGAGFDFFYVPDWYRNFHYRVEARRGFPCEEDLFTPGVFRGELAPGESWTLTASLQRIKPPLFKDSVAQELKRRRSLVPAGWDPVCARLALAADAFIVRRGESGYTVLAGYPWFTDWGRDTMIALPGLTLVTGRTTIARSILQTFAHYCDQGMLPNRFPDSGEAPEYNTVDGTLWFFWALHKYLDTTGDWDLAVELWPTLESILEWHVRGTRYHIRMDDDGLLTAGDEQTQLTWMDVRIGNRAVTPRFGKAVEVNALWYNALRTAERVAQHLEKGEAAERYGSLAERAYRSFEPTFWYREGGYLYDTVNAEGADASIRPNQLLAASLIYPLVSRHRARQIVQCVQHHLWTPMGLRSLSPEDPRYRGRYEGDPVARDEAYHQGTVWAWWIGPFVTAMLYAFGRTEAVQRRARSLIQGLIDHLDDAGLGTISEIADGDAPHTPRGCFAQAWSVGEVLRVLREDLGGWNGNPA